MIRTAMIFLAGFSAFAETAAAQSAKAPPQVVRAAVLRVDPPVLPSPLARYL